MKAIDTESACIVSRMSEADELVMLATCRCSSSSVTLLVAVMIVKLAEHLGRWWGVLQCT